MKRLLLLILITATGTIFSYAQNRDDSSAKGATHQRYGEFNFGAALIRGDMEAPFPGFSLLIGNKTYFKNNVIIDTQIGFALPSIGTAKLGVGYKTLNGEIIVGIRPWPMHFYLQTQLGTTVKGEWIMSVEVSPYTFNRSYGELPEKISMQSIGMLNFGYRWNLL